MGLRPGNVRYYMSWVFRDVELAGRTVLDVGAGNGRFSFYAACVGASKVVSLEPGAHGSRGGVVDRFRDIASHLDLDQVTLVPQRLQDFEPGEEAFDVVLLIAAINHLDEDACIKLHYDRDARSTYGVLFRKLAALANPGAKLVVMDAGRQNLFARLGMKNPLAPTVEWHKHQQPELWTQLLEEAGFRSPIIRWPTFNTLRSPGSVLLGNKLAAYCLQSTFCLTMERAA